MDWTILGIAPTDDKKAITAAYRAKLKTTNPEDKPEKFKALRSAYEEALRLADTAPAERVQDESPVGRWMARVEALYNNYPARICAENWRELLRDDVCAGLDTRPLAEEALLRFLMQHYYLPRGAWQELDAAFSLTDRAEELCETYPRDFIEQCVLNGIRFEQSLRFDLFTPGLDADACDAYRRLYYQCNQTPPDQRGDLLDRMESLPESHPYGRALRCRWLLENGREQEGRDGFRALAEAYPTDSTLALDHAALCLQSGDTDEAEAAIRRVLDREPAHLYAKRLLAECLAARGDLVNAKETIYEVMHASSDDPVTMEQLSSRLREWNATLISRYEAALAADPGDHHSAIELAWCHIQVERPDAAMDVALSIDPDCPDQFGYHNLMGKLYYNIQMFDDAREHLEQAVAILRTMEPGTNPETDKKIRRLPEMLQILGSSLMQLDETDRAKEVFAEALTIAPDEPRVLTLMGNIHYASGEYEQCIAVLGHLLEVSPGSWYAHLMQALSYYRLRRDREAFDAVNRALSMNGGDLSLYVLKMQILLRNGVYDEVRSILDFLQQAGAPEDISVDFIRAQLLELADKDEQAAFRSYQAIARRVEEDEDTLLDNAQLYFRMANLMGKQSNVNRQSDRDILIAMVDKGLAHDPLDADCLRYKAWLLKRSGRLDEAIAMYRDRYTPDAKRQLADLYYSDLRTYAAEALACYEELLQERQTPELYFYAATCCYRMGQLEKAEHYSLLELELDPDDIDAHNHLAYLREGQGRNEAALEHLNRAVAVMWESEQFYSWLVEHQVQVLRRMNRPADALNAIDDAMSRTEYPDGFQLKFDICCQFGLWDQAEAVLAQWAAAKRGDPEQVKATGQLHLYRGKLLKASMAYGKVKHQMSPEEELDLRTQLADLEGNHKRLVQLWTQRLDTHHSRHNALMHLALALYLTGDTDRAKEHAAEALPLVDEQLASYRTDEPMLRTCRSLLLALTGRVEEAREEVALVRTKPLCKHCTYCTCKDADIFEACIEEIAGNYRRALELYRAGQKNWPDELDFVTGENRMKKKKGK